MAKNPLIRSFSKKANKPLPNKSAGILDDYAVRKVIATKEGSITRTPTDDIDMVNKKYVDDNAFSALHADLTDVTPSQHHTATVSADIVHDDTSGVHQDVNTSASPTWVNATVDNDITMEGIFINNMKVADSVGLSIQQPNYTSSSDAAPIDIDFIVNSAASNTGVDISGMGFDITNAHSMTGSAAVADQKTIGITNTIKATGEHTIDANAIFIEEVTGMQNNINIGISQRNFDVDATDNFGSFISTTGMKNDVADNLAVNAIGDHTFTYIGLTNKVAPVISVAGGDIILNLAGETIEVAFGTGVTGGTLEINTYGLWIKNVGGVSGDGNDQIGVFIDSMGGTSSNKYGILDQVSGMDWWLAADNKSINFGLTETDMMMGSDGTNGWIDVATSLRLGNLNTNYTEISPTGDLTFVGSAGVVYGTMSVVSNATETAIATQNVYVQVTNFDTNGVSNNTSPDHTNDHITITKAGDYKIECCITANSVAGAGATFEFEIKKNNGNARIGAAHGDRTLAGGGSEAGAITICAIATLAVNDTVELWTKNETNTQNIIVEDASLSVMQVGG